MANAGHPLCGDRLYGGSQQKIARPALHCSHLSLKQPFTGKKIEIDLELPDDMKRLDK
jgi:23S rRNA pseudouridine1911/1915/1917 synthase